MRFPCLPWWKQVIVGYLAACVFVAAGIGGTLLGESLLTHFYFTVSFLQLTTLLVALFWGVGPGLLASALGCLALSYFSLFPQAAPDPTPLSWDLLFRLLPFTVASVVIAIITGQREAARQLLQRRANELSLLNQELEQANHLKDHFITRAAHELRTPLTAILGEAQLALRRLKKPNNRGTDCQQSFQKVEARAHHLHSLIEDLLELNCSQEREAPVRHAPCDFREICQHVVEDQQALSDRQMVSQLPAHPLMLQGDRERLSQMVTHLVENAVHYSPAHTTISVNVSTDHTGLLLQVTNEGSELSPEQQERVFEPFYRTSLAEHLFREGWGLGLTVTKAIVEQHQGHIWIASSNARGTTFCVHLPFPNEAGPS